MYLRIPSSFRYTAVTKCEYRMLSNSSIVQMDKNESIVAQKMKELLVWYEQITGMNEVHAAQNRVLEEEKKLASAQEQRREVNKMVMAVQAKLRELHAELDSTPRGDDRYVNLITQEHRLLKEERKLTSDLQQYEREERDYFTALSSAVKVSHEKERAQAERTKYWSIIGSVIGTVIGVAGSSLNNHFKLKKLERIVKESIENVKVDSAKIPQLLHKQEEHLNEIVTEIKTLGALPSKKLSHVVSESDSVDKMDKVLKLLDKQQAVLQNRLKELEVLIKRVIVSTAIENATPASQSKPGQVTVVKESLVPETSEDLIEPSSSTPYPFTEVNINKAVGVGIVVFVVVILFRCCFR